MNEENNNNFNSDISVHTSENMENNTNTELNSNKVDENAEALADTFSDENVEADALNNENTVADKLNEVNNEANAFDDVNAEADTFDETENVRINCEGDKNATKVRCTPTAYRRTIALGLAGTILCGASLGISLGVGLNASKNLFAKNGGDFSFAADTNENAQIEATATANSITPSADSVAKVYNSAKDSVVNISITVKSMGFFNQTYENSGSGSGIIYSQDDEKIYVVTNNHVVDGASSVKISITGDEQVNAKLVGKDASSDLAVISVLKSDLKAAGINSVSPAKFGKSDNMEVGEFVIAIGNALGEGKTATRGIISAVNKEINIDGKKLQVIQTDAAINPGNSGGALVNTAGEVVGINTAKLASSSIEGTGYAIPTYVAVDIIDELMEKGTVDKPYLGIQVYNIDDQFRRIYNIDYNGVFVVNVEQGSAAEKAGLQESDIITGVNGKTILSGDDLSAEINKHKSGENITFDVIRNGREQMTITATLANQNELF